MSDSVSRDDAEGVATLTLLRPGLSHALRTDLLAVYVNDHLAAAAGGIELVSRMIGVHRGTEYEQPLRQLLDDIEAQPNARLAEVVQSPQFTHFGERADPNKETNIILRKEVAATLKKIENKLPGVALAAPYASWIVRLSPSRRASRWFSRMMRA